MTEEFKLARIGSKLALELDDMQETINNGTKLEEEDEQCSTLMGGNFLPLEE